MRQVKAKSHGLAVTDLLDYMLRGGFIGAVVHGDFVTGAAKSEGAGGANAASGAGDQCNFLSHDLPLELDRLDWRGPVLWTT